MLGDRETREAARRLLLEIPMPEYRPPYTNLFADPGGTLWVVTSAPGDPVTSQVPAEIISTLALMLDRPEVPDDLAAALTDLELPAGHPAAFGRSLAFDPSGERRADDLGHVLAIFPGRDGVLAFGPVASGAVGGLPGTGGEGSSLAKR